MSLFSDFGPLIEHGEIRHANHVAAYELRGTDHPIVYVYTSDGQSKQTHHGGSPAAVVAGMLLAEIDREAVQWP